MIKVSVLYPQRADARFDFDYYLGAHMDLVRRLLGPACTGIAVEQGLCGADAEAPPAYIAMGHLYFDSVTIFQAAFGPHAGTIMGDLANFTDCQPQVQISEVRLAL